MKIDLARLLGFRIIGSDAVRLSAKIGAKPGAKPDNLMEKA